jgi:hypothetical protein
MEPPHAAGFQVVCDAVRFLADMAIDAVDKKAMAPPIAWDPLASITKCL